MDVGVRDFEDIAVYFSEEEWSYLGEDQRRLYKDVMMENYRAVRSLGRFYLKPEIISKIEQGKQPCVQDRALYDGEIPIAYFIVKPDILSQLPEVLDDDDESDCIYLEIDSDSETELGRDSHTLDPEDLEDDSLSDCVYVESDDRTTAAQVRGTIVEHVEDDNEDGSSDCVYVDPENKASTQRQKQSLVDLYGAAKAAEVDRIIEDSLIPINCGTDKNQDSPSNNLLNVWYVKRVENITRSHKEVLIPGSPGNEKHKEAEEESTHDQITDLELLCPMCPQIFTNVSRFFDHQKVHEPKTPVCPECGARFSDSLALERHVLLHIEEKIQVCQECGQCFSTRSSLEIHMKTHKGDKQWSCPDCGKFLYSKSGLDRHQLLHVRDKLIPCPQCGKCFMKQSNYEMHLRLHAGEDVYPCTECEKIFSSKSACERHVKAHTMERPHGCPECGKRFLYNGCLIKHMRVHTGEKPYVCPDCGRGFAQSSGLNSHRKLHEDEKPYVCPECKKCFAKKLHFDKHLKIHAKDRLLDEISQRKGENVSSLLTKSKDVSGVAIPYTYKPGDKSDSQRHLIDVLLKNRQHGDAPLTERPVVNDPYDTRPGMDRSLSHKPYGDVLLSERHVRDVTINGGPLGVVPSPMRGLPYNRGSVSFNGMSGEDVSYKSRFLRDVPLNSWAREGLSFMDISSNKQSMGENSFRQIPTSGVYHNPMGIHDRSRINDPNNNVPITRTPFIDFSLYGHPVPSRAEEKQQHVCPECGKGFPYNGCLVKHLRTHTGEKPFSCSECGKCFAQTSTLNCHKRTHTGERPYICPQCGKGFTSQSHVVRHQAIHNVKRSFLCNGCGKEFSQRCYLIKHQKRTACPLTLQ